MDACTDARERTTSAGNALRIPAPRMHETAQKAPLQHAESDRAIAIVVGLCGHGLALVRSLTAAGTRVVALERNRELPGWHTSLCEVEYVDSIEGDSLIASLRAARPRLGEANPVLFLTNDRMTGSVARRIEDVRHLYRISWHSSAAEVLKLTDKTNLAERCLDKQLHYPAERIFHQVTDLLGARLELQYPLILKPSQPLSAFKTIIVRKPADIEKHQAAISRALPVLAQEFIPGNDEQIYFVALYLSNGKPKAIFEGRKLRSRPMGHTTVAVSSPCPEAREIALRFFAGTDYCGPASLEMKRAPDGRLIVIEPTVGRSDFWIDVCVRNGVDLPAIEYLDQTSGEETLVNQRNLAVWINEERDPFAWIWLCLTHPGTALKRFPVFVYAHQSDLMPWWQHARIFGRSMVRKVSKRGFPNRYSQR